MPHSYGFLGIGQQMIEIERESSFEQILFALQEVPDCDAQNNCIFICSQNHCNYEKEIALDHVIMALKSVFAGKFAKIYLTPSHGVLIMGAYLEQKHIIDFYTHLTPNLLLATDPTEMWPATLFHLVRDREELLKALINKSEYNFDALVSTDESPDSSADIPKTILVVEDDAYSALIINTVLSKTCNVIIAPDGITALRLFKSFQPDMVFLDIGLPDISGENLLAEFRLNNPHTSIIMLTGYSDVNHITSSMELGAAGFISKPVSKEKILHFVDRLPLASLQQNNVEPVNRRQFI